MTTLWRTAVVMAGGIGGFCVSGAGWFLAGSWWTHRLGAQYPPAGAVDMPNPEVIEAAFLTLLGTPVAAVVGGIVGTVITWLLVCRGAGAEQSDASDPPARM
jgi:hypothetical protein